MRSFNRKSDEIRPINIERGRSKNAEGSCLIKCGDTEVLCMASIEEKIPVWLRGSNSGWVTAEYGMLPRATNTRLRREANSGKQSGRTLEIQRLIGRSLRAVVDLKKLGERTIIIDCDVLNADGGTRTTSITGAFIALNDAVENLIRNEKLKTSPIKQHLAAISCGILDGKMLLDLDYSEDSTADTDANFVMTEDGRIVEIQGTAEKDPFSIEELSKMTKLAKKGIDELIKLQKLTML